MTRDPLGDIFKKFAGKEVLVIEGSNNQLSISPLDTTVAELRAALKGLDLELRINLRAKAFIPTLSEPGIEANISKVYGSNKYKITF